MYSVTLCSSAGVVQYCAMGILDTIRNTVSGATPAAVGRSGSVVGIDIGSSAIKVVQLRQSKGKAILETYGEIALGPYIGTEVGRITKLPAADTAQALVDLMKEANVTAKASGISIPFSSSLTSVVELPRTTDAKKLKQMIPLEARKYIPVPIHEVMLDWLIIPGDPAEREWSRARAEKDEKKKKEEGDKVEVLLVAIHNEVLNNYQTISKTATLNTGFYELEIFSTIRSSLGHGIAPVMIIDMGASSTKVYIVERGIVRTSHLINIGSQELTIALTRAFSWNFEHAERIKREQGILPDQSTENPEHEQLVRDTLLSTLGRIFVEVNRVLLSYEKKYGKDISRVVLAGGGAGLPGFGEYVKGQVPVEAKLSDPFNKIQTPAFLTDILQEVGPEFAVAVGTALRRLRA